MIRSTLFSLFAFISMGCFAQSGGTRVEKEVLLFGRVTEMNLEDSSESVLKGAVIQIWANGDSLTTLTTDLKGKYRCTLPYFRIYEVRYGKAPYVTKSVVIDASDFAQQTRLRGFNMEIDMALFKADHCDQLQFLNSTPIARASYSKRAETIVWDEELTVSVNERIRAALVACK